MHKIIVVLLSFMLIFALPVLAQGTTTQQPDEQALGGGIIGAIIGAAIMAAIYFSPVLKKIADRAAKMISADDIAKSEHVQQTIADAAKNEATAQIDSIVKQVSSQFEARIQFVQGQFAHAQERGDQAEIERRKDKEAAESERRQLFNDVRGLQTNYQAAQAEIATLTTKVVELEGKLTTVTSERDLAKEDASRAWAQVAELRGELATTNRNLSQTRDEVSSLREQLAEIRGERNAMKTLVDRIEFVTASEHAAESASQEDATLTQEKKAG